MFRGRQKQLHIFLWIVGIITLCCMLCSYIGGSGSVRLAQSAAGIFDDAWVLQGGANGDEIIYTPAQVKAEEGQQLVLKKRLPEVLPENTVLLVETAFQHFDLKIGNTPLYSCGQRDNHTIGREPFPGYYMIPMDGGYAGYEIEIAITSDYGLYAGDIGTLMLGSRGDVILTLLKEHLAGFAGGVLLLILAVVMFLLKAGMGGFAKRKYEFTYVTLMLFLFGVYMICSNGLPRLLFEGTQGLYISSMLVVLLIPFLYEMYLYAIVDRRQVLKFVNCAMILLIINYVIAFVLVVLDLVDVVVCCVIAVIAELVILGILTFILSAAAVKYKRGDLTYHAISNIVFFIFLLAGLIMGYSEQLAPYRHLVLTAGILIWCFLMLFHAEGRIAETIQGELLIERNALSEYKRQTLKNLMPDTLFGGLHTLLDMMKRQDERAPKYLVQFSNYLRGRLNMLHYEQNVLIPFEEEMTHITGCLELVMHKNANFEYETEIKVTDFLVPAFSIEAFVENAVHYGAGTAKKPSLISVKTYETAKDYAVQIVDTGCGFDVDAVKSRSEYSIYKMTERLQNTVDATVDVKSRTGKGTVVTIKLPKNRQTEKEMTETK